MTSAWTKRLHQCLSECLAQAFISQVGSIRSLRCDAQGLLRGEDDDHRGQQTHGGLGEAGARGSEVEAALQLRASVRCGWGCAEDAADPQSELSVAAKGVDRSPAACEVAMKAAGGFMTGLSAGL
eukprot:s2871_g3.t1